MEHNQGCGPFYSSCQLSVVSPPFSVLRFQSSVFRSPFSLSRLPDPSVISSVVCRRDEWFFNSFVEKGERNRCQCRSHAGLRGVPQKLATRAPTPQEQRRNA
jgi:hypothetical protein